MLTKLLTITLFASIALAGDLVFTVAGLQLTPKPWDKQANLAKLEDFARRAAGQGAQLVMTPEGFLEGYVGNQGRTPDLSWEKYAAVGEAIDGPIMTRVRDLARELRIYLLVGFAERRHERMYNSVAIFSPDGRLIHRYSKTHTANDEPLNTKGTDLPIVDTPFGRWGTLICFDRQLPETARILTLKGAQFILVPSWGGYGEINDIMMRVRAYENGTYLAFVHPKRCLFIDPKGSVIAKNDGEDDQIVMARIDLSKQTKAGGPIRGRRPELYGELLGK
jgi:predicted amidohydrolase